MTQEEGNLDAEGKPCGPELQDTAGSPALPCRHRGLLASEGSGGQVCGAEVQEPNKETHNPQAPQQGPSPGTPGNGTCRFRTDLLNWDEVHGPGQPRSGSGSGGRGSQCTEGDQAAVHF